MTPWKNLVEDHQRNNLFTKLNQVKLKSVQWFLTRRFSKFSIYIYRENKPHPLTAMFFWQIRIAWTFLVEGHQSNVEIGQGYLTRRISKFSIQIYTENKPRPLWGPCFLTYHESLNNLGRRSPFLSSYIEFGVTVSYKKIFKVFYIDI